MAFERLLRFALDGAILYGDLVEAKEGSCLVRKLHGSIAEGFFPRAPEEITSVSTVRYECCCVP